MSQCGINVGGIGLCTTAHIAVLLLVLVNQILISVGYPILPINDADLCAITSTGLTVCAALVSWWKATPRRMPRRHINICRN